MSDTSDWTASIKSVPWLVSTGMSILVATVTATWWVSGLNNRVVNAEDKIRSTDAKIEQLILKLDTFTREQHEHNVQDATHAARIDEKLETLVSEFRMLHQELGLHQPEEHYPPGGKSRR